MMLKEEVGAEHDLTLENTGPQTQRKEMMKAVDVSFIKLMKAIDAYTNKNLTKSSVQKLLKENQLNLEKHGG